MWTLFCLFFSPYLQMLTIIVSIDTLWKLACHHRHCSTLEKGLFCQVFFSAGGLARMPSACCCFYPQHSCSTPLLCHSLQLFQKQQFITCIRELVIFYLGPVALQLGGISSVVHTIKATVPLKESLIGLYLQREKCNASAASRVARSSQGLSCIAWGWGDLIKWGMVNGKWIKSYWNK